MIRKAIYYIAIFLVCGSSVVTAADSAEAKNSVMITEISGSNSLFLDEDEDSPDWIEIFNGSGSEVDLEGWGLGDSSEAAEWIFPAVSISPGEHLLVFASGKDRRQPGGELHTNFKLSEKDAGVYLFSDNGTIQDQIDIEKLPKNVSYGRYQDAGELVYFPEPTPGKANNTAPFSPVVQYSVKGGLYRGPVSVRLYTRDRDATIYYTTDGSTPTVASQIYSGPVKVDKNCTIRAISLKPRHYPSPPSGNTYFIDFDNKGMAIVAVSAEAGKIWDPERGLLRQVTYKDNMVRDLVRVHVSYFDENGKPGFSQDAVMGVVGASSREVMMRPLKLSANPDIDPLNGTFKYRLLAKDIDEYRHFQLRNNNQDGVRYLDDPECLPTMGMRNALFCELVRDQDGMQIRDDSGPILFFINGKNYGMMNIGEKRDNTGISANNPGVDSKDIDLIVVRNDMGLRVERGKFGKGTVHIRHDAKVVYKGYFEDGAIEYEEISEAAKKSGSTKGLDDFIAVDPTDPAQLDPKSFIASMAAHIIACNTDFGMNNIGFWREARVGEEPGPFQTYSFDFDSIFGLDMWREDYDTLLVYMEDTHLFPGFMSKEEYRSAFVRKLDQYLNGPFSPERALPIIDRLEKKMEPWIAHHLELWAGGQMDKEQWHKNVENLRNYMKVRPKFVRMFARDFFDFEGYSNVTFSVSPEGGGSIKLDAGAFKTTLEGKGKYANIPMKLYAKASRGYKFSHFNVDGENISENGFSLDPREGMEIMAVFVEYSGPAAEIVINEVVRAGAQKLIDEDGDRQDWIEIHNTTERKIELGGMYLTDNEEKLKKWKFPDVSIGPGEFKLIFASGKDRSDPAGNLHTSFKLSDEPVLIVDADGETVVDMMTLKETASIEKNGSGIRYPDGSSVFMSSALSTPGSPNTLGETTAAGKYAFSG